MWASARKSRDEGVERVPAKGKACAKASETSWGIALGLEWSQSPRTQSPRHSRAGGWASSGGFRKSLKIFNQGRSDFHSRRVPLAAVWG